MDKELTRIEISKIADKVIDLIKSEVGDSQNLLKTVLYECDAQVEIDRRLKHANS